jgi:hypothetical protein
LRRASSPLYISNIASNGEIVKICYTEKEDLLIRELFPCAKYLARLLTTLLVAMPAGKFAELSSKNNIANRQRNFEFTRQSD